MYLYIAFISNMANNGQQRWYSNDSYTSGSNPKKVMKFYIVFAKPSFEDYSVKEYPYGGYKRTEITIPIFRAPNGDTASHYLSVDLVLIYGPHLPLKMEYLYRSVSFF